MKTTLELPIDLIRVADNNLRLKGLVSKVWRAALLPNELLHLPPLVIAAPDGTEIAAAHGAFLAFGKGSGHPASLDSGAIFSYALVKVRDIPSLYKGRDLRETDLRARRRADDPPSRAPTRASSPAPPPAP